ncbi:hypothetical protein IKP85_03485 [bacterium]|nr:hypothetical protein [bacterium]
MGKFVGFIICLVVAIGIGVLSLIQNSLICSDAKCSTQSKLAYINVVLNEDIFYKNDVQSLACATKVQPSRRGKNKYYVLELNKYDDAPYILGSYKKYEQCKADLKSIKDFFNEKIPSIYYDSGIGFSNTMGFIFAFVMLFAGIIILKSKDKPGIEDWEDDDEKEG